MKTIRLFVTIISLSFLTFCTSDDESGGGLKPASQCCIVCEEGESACGDNCIPANQLCNEPEGCACDAS